MAAEMPVWLVQQPASRLAGYFLLVDAMFVPLYFKLHAGIDSIWYEQINKAQKSTYIFNFTKFEMKTLNENIFFRILY